MHWYKKIADMLIIDFEVGYSHVVRYVRSLFMGGFDTLEEILTCSRDVYLVKQEDRDKEIQ